MTSEFVESDGYRFRLVNIECLPYSSNFNAIMELSEPIDELLPHLAAFLPACTYIHGSGVINLMDRGHIIAIYPTYLTITDVRGRQDAESFCGEYYEKIRHVRTNMRTISPIYDRRCSITVLDILRALPKTNCGDCGSPSCTAFAAKVFRRDAVISQCPPLIRDQEGSRNLFEQLQRNGYST